MRWPVIRTRWPGRRTERRLKPADRLQACPTGSEMGETAGGLIVLGMAAVCFLLAWMLSKVGRR